MNKLAFVKYQGTGNDFVLVDDWDGQWERKLDVDRVRTLCDRHWGVGADGLMLLQRDEEVDYRMVYYNSDGLPSTMCGNGARCLAHYAHALDKIGNKAVFRAVDGLHQVLVHTSGEVELEMRPVPQVKRLGADWEIDTGSPHYVKYVESVDQIPVVEWGRAIRNNDRYRKEGINVNFVEQADGAIKVRTYERGVEDETLSCGTGVTAAALSYAAQMEDRSGSVQVETPGGHLLVHYKKEGEGFGDVWLVGPATRVFEGVWHLVEHP